MRNKSGITLIELVVAIAVFVIFISLIAVFFFSGLDRYKTNSERLTSQFSMRAVMFELSNNLRKAELENIAVNEDNNAITVEGAVYAYTSEDETISKTISGNTTILARNISNFHVEITDRTITFTVQSSTENESLTGAVTLQNFVRPSPT